MAEAFQKMNSKDLEVFAAILLKEKVTRKYKFKFMQRVYVRTGLSGNYLDNFSEGFIVDVDKKYIRIISEEGRTAIRVINDPSLGTVFTTSQFKPIYDEMIQSGRLTDPARKVHQQKILRLFEAERIGDLDSKASKRRGITRIEEFDTELRTAKRFLAKGEKKKKNKNNKVIRNGEFVIRY